MKSDKTWAIPTAITLLICGLMAFAPRLFIPIMPTSARLSVEASLTPSGPTRVGETKNLPMRVTSTGNDDVRCIVAVDGPFVIDAVLVGDTAVAPRQDGLGYDIGRLVQGRPVIFTVDLTAKEAGNDRLSVRFYAGDGGFGTAQIPGEYSWDVAVDP